MSHVLNTAGGGQAAVLVPGGAAEALNSDKGEVREAGAGLWVGQAAVLGEAPPEGAEGLRGAGPEVRRPSRAHLLLRRGRHLREGGGGGRPD